MIRRSKDRGYSKNGWLESSFSFSFAEYYDPNNMGFGVLRVLNDDKISPMSGFGMHPHRDMEIITIVMKGQLEHRDSMGFVEILDNTKVQYMSAGKGVKHSEINNGSDILELFQIWIKPSMADYEPRYESRIIMPDMYKNKFLNIAGGFGDEILQIRQKAVLYRGAFEAGKNISLSHKQSLTGWYLFLISGEIEIDGERLSDRDSFTVIKEEEINIATFANSDILLFDLLVNS